MLVEKILHFILTATSFVPIIEKAHVSYISSGKVTGLSKINRIVEMLLKDLKFRKD